jgi:hypothetical protein
LLNTALSSCTIISGCKSESQHVIGSVFNGGKYPRLLVGDRAASLGSSQRIHSSKVPKEKLSSASLPLFWVFDFRGVENSSMDDGSVYVADGNERSVGEMGEVLADVSAEEQEVKNGGSV